MKAFFAIASLLPLVANSAIIGHSEGVVTRGVCPEVTTVADLDFERVLNFHTVTDKYDV